MCYHSRTKTRTISNLVKLIFSEKYNHSRKALLCYFNTSNRCIELWILTLSHHSGTKTRTISYLLKVDLIQKKRIAVEEYFIPSFIYTSLLHIGKTSPASPCRLNLFLSPRNLAMLGGFLPMAKSTESGAHHRSWVTLRCPACSAW